jgi:NADH-quinone oxidoreductase subunit A
LLGGQAAWELIMTSPMASSMAIVAYLALFSGVGIVFLFVNLLVGKFLRPANPHPEKLEIYECGEPTIGSSFVQFDLRFYVVALLFILFDVEVAFFFPWAAVFGKATNAARLEPAQIAVRGESGQAELTETASLLYREMGVRNPVAPTTVPATLRDAVPAGDDVSQAAGVFHAGMEQLAWLTIVDILAFFAVLLIGFAYVWKRGDLDWVRAVGQPRAISEREAPAHYGDPLEEEQFLSA